MPSDHNNYPDKIDSLTEMRSHWLKRINPSSSSHAKQSLPANCNSYVFDFPKADYDSICHFLMDIDFNHCLYSTDLEHIWWCIKNAIYAGMNLFIPKSQNQEAPVPLMVHSRTQTPFQMSSNAL